MSERAVTEKHFHSIAIAELDAVYRMACHLARNGAEAEDFVQETYLRAFRSADTFVLGTHGIRPWLFKILHNVISSRGSQRQREKSLLQDLQHKTPADDLTLSHQPADCASMNWEHVDERVKVAVASLPLPNRMTFMLWALEGLKYREIAEVTNVPVGTVMSRLARARAQLAQTLADFGSELRLTRSTGSGVESQPDNML